jgi:hypothetical protein
MILSSRMVGIMDISSLRLIELFKTLGVVFEVQLTEELLYSLMNATRGISTTDVSLRIGK